MSWTKVDYDVAMEVAAHEAVIRQAYKDGGGVWTWSVGLTSATGHNVNRYIGKPASMERCMEVYVWALDNYAETVRAVFNGYELTKAQFAAALSFHWNTGAIRRASWVDRFKDGDAQQAKNAFKAWNKDNGKVVAGLVNRRDSEWKLFSSGVWSNDGSMTEYTRLTSRSTPDWGSATKVDVSRALSAAFAKSAEDVQDHPSDPDATVEHPTLSPEGNGKPPPLSEGSVPPWFVEARKYIGLQEIRGSADNPEIVKMFADSGYPQIKNDETAWCAAFVGAVLKRSGLKGTGSLAARSYLKWGKKIDKPEIGCIVVLWRSSPDSWKGHVGFYAGEGKDHIKILGGNQNNTVNVRDYPKDRLLGYRWPSSRPVSSDSNVAGGGIGGGALAGGAVASQGHPWIGFAIFVAAIVVVGGFILYRKGKFHSIMERIKSWF